MQKLLNFFTQGSDSRDLEVVLTDAQTLYEGYKFEDALAVYIASYDQGKSSPQFLIGIAQCYQKLNLHLIATQYFQYAIDLDPTTLEAYLGLGYESIISGDFAQADQMLRTTQGLYREQPHTYGESMLAKIEELKGYIISIQNPKK